MATVLTRLIWISIVVVVPGLGVWIASSLTAYQNGPVWLACLAGLLLFPILPLAWDGLWALRRTRRASKRGDVEPSAPALTLWDRMVLRTLTLNAIFVVGLVAARPVDTFAALSARGDWPIEGMEHPAAERARTIAFSIADRLEWLYLWANPNEFGDMLDDHGKGSAPDRPEPSPGEDRNTATKDRGKTKIQIKPRKDEHERKAPERPKDDTDVEGRPGPVTEVWVPEFDGPWPMDDELHPLVVDMPASAKSSIAEVGKYIKDNESDPFGRVKALHDFATVRVQYDAPALAAGVYPPQDAPTVFETGLGVCAGYANLMVALGEAADTDIVWVQGYARRPGGEISGVGHAWNAVQVEGKWYLLDATWDAGHVTGDVFTANYGTSYLFTPPDVFAMSHIPDDPDWQLRKVAYSRGEFMRLPTLKPRFYAHGWELLGPRRAQVSGSRFELEVQNEAPLFMLVDMEPKGGGSRENCEVAGSGSGHITALCEPSQPGQYEVRLFDSAERYDTYSWVGSFQLNY